MSKSPIEDFSCVFLNLLLNNIQMFSFLFFPFLLDKTLKVNSIGFECLGLGGSFNASLELHQCVDHTDDSQ